MYMSAKAAALNAATLALLDTSSVAMRAVPVALAMAQTNAGLVLDPTKEEEDSASARYVFGWAFGSGISSTSDGMETDEEESELVWAESEGSFTRQEVRIGSYHTQDCLANEQYDAASDQSKLAAREILAYYRQVMGDHLAKRLAFRTQ
jgi:exosome complex component RRP46